MSASWGPARWRWSKRRASRAPAAARCGGAAGGGRSSGGICARGGAALCSGADLEPLSHLGPPPLPRPRPRPRPPPPLQLVVVKTFKPGAIASAEDFREMLMESAKLARLAHP
jgi:hypothetical protein